MKKIIMTMAAAIMISASVTAQDNKQDGQKPERKYDKTEMVKKRTDDAVKRYGLNDKQAKQLLDLNTKYADKMRGPHRGPHHHGGMRPPHDGKMDQGKDNSNRPERPKMTEEQKAQMEKDMKQQGETMKAYDAELQKILTSEQYKKYKEDMQKRGPRGPKEPRGHKPQKDDAKK